MPIARSKIGLCTNTSARCAALPGSCQAVTVSRALFDLSDAQGKNVKSNISSATIRLVGSFGHEISADHACVCFQVLMWVCKVLSQTASMSG